MKVLSRINIDLIAVSTTSPSVCAVGENYFNTTTKLLYTAIDTNTWSPSGNKPIFGLFYVDVVAKNLYFYNGDTLVSIFDNLVPVIGVSTNVDLGEYNIIANNLSGTNTGDETTSTIKSLLGWPSNNGGVLQSDSLGNLSWLYLDSAHMIYPSAGIAVSLGTGGWGTSIVDNSSNWNSAYTNMHTHNNLTTLNAISRTDFVFTNQTTPQTIGTTEYRLSKLWVTDITVTNAIVGNITGQAASVQGLTITSPASISGTNTGDQDLSGFQLKLYGQGFVRANGEDLFFDTNEYQELNTTLTNIAALGLGSDVGFLVKTALNTWALNNTTYLTEITKNMVEEVLIGEITSHTHTYIVTETDPVFVAAFKTSLDPLTDTEVSSSKAVATYITGLNFQTANTTLSAISTIGAHETSTGVLIKTDQNVWSILDATNLASYHTHNSLSNTYTAGVTYINAISLGDPTDKTITISANTIELEGTIGGPGLTNVLISGNLGITGALTCDSLAFSENFILPITSGGTGSSTVSGFYTNFNIGTMANVDYTYDAQTHTLLLVNIST